MKNKLVIILLISVLALLSALFFLPLPLSPPVPKVEVLKDQEYFYQVNSLIKEATTSIKVIAFEMGWYPEHPLSPSNILIKNLIAARERGVEVRVILEISDWNERVTKKNKYSGQVLSENNIKVRYDSPSVTTHAKLIIADSSSAILGSNNWTYYSLTQNKELSLLVKTPSVIGELEDYFNKLWEVCTP